MASHQPYSKRFLGDDEMTRRDLVPGPGQAGRDRQLVLFFAERGLRFDHERRDDLAVQALPDICRTLGTKPRPLL